MLLAAQGPAFAQSPNIQLQVQPKLQIQPKISKPPVLRPMIPLSMAQRNIQNRIPNSTVLKIGPLPSGDIIATIKIKNQIKKVRVDGQTGAVQD
ncbi:MAG: hypothetical protein ACOZAM_33805 [Pseudomonadota bacterium]